MDEFVDRMTTQRQVLDIVNRSEAVSVEKLFGLSSDAIDRWMVANAIHPKSEIVRLLQQVSAELFFMATRSQEPVSSEYKLRVTKIVNSVSALELVVNTLYSEKSL